MATVVLNDDFPLMAGAVVVLDSGCEEWPSRLGVGPGVTVAEPTNVGVTAVIYQRIRIGYSEDGIPQFAWGSLGEFQVIGAEKRQEIDPVAGVTYAAAKVTLLHDGDPVIFETCAVRDSAGDLWRVVSSVRSGSTVVLDVRLIDQQDALLTEVAASPTAPGGPTETIQEILADKADVGHVHTGAGGTMEFTQADPASTWTIVHTLGGRPDVRLFETADPNSEVFTDLVYLNDGATIVVTWPEPTSGWAYIG